jgi:hypothetical protein
MSKQIQDAYIVATTRTPVGKAPRGMFRNTRPDEMLAHVLKAVVTQAPGIDANRISDIIVGCAMPEGEQGMNVARIGALLAGLPIGVPAQTINRFCSSGVQAVALAADRIRSGTGRRHRVDEHGADDGPQGVDEHPGIRERQRRHCLRHGHHRGKSSRTVEGQP